MRITDSRLWGVMLSLRDWRILSLYFQCISSSDVSLLSLWMNNVGERDLVLQSQETGKTLSLFILLFLTLVSSSSLPLHVRHYRTELSNGKHLAILVVPKGFNINSLTFLLSIIVPVP